jgi:hypothetical protein
MRSTRKEGFPPEVRAILQTAHKEEWSELRLLLAIPEYQVASPGVHGLPRQI